jgi:hypothetical protein
MHDETHTHIFLKLLNKIYNKDMQCECLKYHGCNCVESFSIDSSVQLFNIK